MNIEQLRDKYMQLDKKPHDEGDPYGYGYVNYPSLNPFPGCCSAMVLSGFGSDWPAPEHFGDFIDEVEATHKKNYAVLFAVLLQSQMKYGEILAEKGWEESSQMSRSNYDKDNLMRVFIKSMRPVQPEEIVHAAKKREAIAERKQKAIETQKRQQAEAAENKKKGVYVGRYDLPYIDPYAPPPIVAYDNCECGVCKEIREKEAKEKTKEKKAA